MTIGGGGHSRTGPAGPPADTRHLRTPRERGSRRPRGRPSRGRPAPIMPSPALPEDRRSRRGRPAFSPSAPPPRSSTRPAHGHRLRGAAGPCPSRTPRRTDPGTRPSASTTPSPRQPWCRPGFEVLGSDTDSGQGRDARMTSGESSRNRQWRTSAPLCPSATASRRRHGQARSRRSVGARVHRLLAGLSPAESFPSGCSSPNVAVSRETPPPSNAKGSPGR